jgi:4-hydroxy-tetrahydrodipicolinate synthase
MPSARDARDWAAADGLHGIGDTLYTPFSGPGGVTASRARRCPG